jgi:hypothetical protein
LAISTAACRKIGFNASIVVSNDPILMPLRPPGTARSAHSMRVSHIIVPHFCSNECG